MQVHKLFFLALAFIALISSASCSRKDQLTLPPIFGDDVILAFGDSLTYGTGAGRKNSYPSVLSSLSGLKVINEGVPGEQTQGGLNRLEKTLDKHKPSLVILCLGGNDFLRKVDEESTRRNLQAMIGIIRTRGLPVVMMAVPGFGLSFSPHPVFREIADANQIILLEDLIPSILSDRSLKSDPIHPNEAGYRKLAMGLHEELQKRGAL